MRALALLAAVVTLAACGGSGEEAAEVRDLSGDVEALRADFAEHEGSTRVVLLFAPT